MIYIYINIYSYIRYEMGQITTDLIIRRDQNTSRRLVADETGFR